MAWTYRVPVLETFSWQEPVISIADSPSSFRKGDRFIVGQNPINEFTGHTNDIAWFDGTDWKFDVPSDGHTLFIISESLQYQFVNGEWKSALHVTQIDTSDNQFTWILKDNDPDAFNFKVGSDTGPTFLNFDTTTGSENATFKYNVTIDGDLTVKGTTTTIDSTQLIVNDPVFTLNKGGLIDTARESGFEIEVNDPGTGGDPLDPDYVPPSTFIGGYIKSTPDSALNPGFDFKSPDSEHQYSIQIDAAATENFTLVLGSNVTLDQDLSKTSDVEFNKVTITSGELSDGLGNTVNIADLMTSTYAYDQALECLVFDQDTRIIYKPIYINSYSPANNDTNVDPSINLISISYDGDISLNTTGSIILRDETNGADILNLDMSTSPSEITIDSTNKILQISSINLTPNTQYSVTITDALINSNEADIENVTNYGFTTTTPIILPPSITLDPGISATLTYTNTNISIDYSKAIAIGTGNLSLHNIADADSTNDILIDITSSDVTIDVTGNILLIDISNQSLQPGATYLVSIDSSAII